MLNRIQATQKRAQKIQATLAPSPTNTKAPPFRAYLKSNDLEINRVADTIATLVDQSRTKEIRAVISTPPRHGKTETLLHAVSWLLQKDASKTHAYATYGQHLANTKSRRARRLTQEAGVQFDPSSTSVSEWRTTLGGGLLATGVGGPLTGQGITGLGIVDDPFKNRQEAESSLIRDRVWEWFTDVFYTRLEPGASVILIATRWHPDDLSGRLIDEGWEYYNLPAIQNGDALWPEKYSKSKLLEIKEQVGEYAWASLYQGEPRPRGGTVFNEPTLYDELPKGDGYREAHGFDAAYTAKTHADYSVTLTGRLYGEKLYLTNMIRAQLEPRQYIARLKAEGIKRVTWMLSGTEKGLEAFFKDYGIHVNGVPARGDKFVRAQPAAAMWNAQKILVPRDAAWADDFLDEVLNFTGLNDAHDDTVDALAALHYALTNTTEPRVRQI